MSTKSNVDPTCSNTPRPSKRRRLASPIELTRPEPALTPDATVTPISPSLPLTRENLREFTKMASAGPSTPRNRGSASQPTTSKSSAATKASGVPAEVREALRDYYIFVNEIKLWSPQLSGHLRDFIEANVTSTRSSPTITREKHEAIMSVYDKFRYANEATLSEQLKDHIFTIPSKFLDTSAAALARVAQVQFRPGFIPIPDASDDINLQSILKSAKVPKNPEPDHMFGLQEFGVFTENERKLLRSIQDDTRVAPQLLFPFLSVEWKAEIHSGNADTARSQAARSGAAIVNAMRNLYAYVSPNGDPDAHYPNLAARTACFSCIIAGRAIEVWVHWFRFDEDGKIGWHSTQVIEIFVNKYQDNFTELHKVLHNILDWGSVGRLYQIREVLDTLNKQRIEAAGEAAGKAAGSKRKAPSSSP